MTHSLLTEWLEDFVELEPHQLKSYASEQQHNVEIITLLYQVFEDRHKHNEKLEPVCNQLFAYYRSGEVELKRFTLQFIPVLIGTYLSAISRNEKRQMQPVEALLIGVYNLEVVDSDGNPKTISFRIPSVIQASLYHERSGLSSSYLAGSVLRRLEECNTKSVCWGPMPQVETLNAQTRLKVMTALMFVYNQHTSYYSKMSLEMLCKITTRIVSQGFMRSSHMPRGSLGNDPSSNVKTLPRIPVTSTFLIELLHSIYIAYFQNLENVANHAIDHIHHRACYEGFADTQLLSNAVRHYIHNNLSGVPSERPVGIIAETSDSYHSVTTSKSMITTASFKIKKLPDDIPIQDKEDGGEKNLVSISEEREDGTSVPEKGRASTKSNKEIMNVQKGLSKLPTFSGLGKKLSKDKEKEKLPSVHKNVTSPEANDTGNMVNRRTSSLSSGTKDASTSKNTARNSLIGTVVMNGGDNGVDDYHHGALSRKKSGNASETQAAPQINGPIIELKNGTGAGPIVSETEKVSLVSDSLQSVDYTNTSDSLEASEASLTESDQHDQLLQTATTRLNIQVSSV